LSVQGKGGIRLRTKISKPKVTRPRKKLDVVADTRPPKKRPSKGSSGDSSYSPASLLADVLQANHPALKRIADRYQVRGAKHGVRREHANHGAGGDPVVDDHANFTNEVTY